MEISVEVEKETLVETADGRLHFNLNPHVFTTLKPGSLVLHRDRVDIAGLTVERNRFNVLDPAGRPREGFQVVGRETILIESVEMRPVNVPAKTARPNQRRRISSIARLSSSENCARPGSIRKASSTWALALG